MKTIEINDVDNQRFYYEKIYDLLNDIRDISTYVNTKEIPQSYIDTLSGDLLSNQDIMKLYNKIVNLYAEVIKDYHKVHVHTTKLLSTQGFPELNIPAGSKLVQLTLKRNLLVYLTPDDIRHPKQVILEQKHKQKLIIKESL